MKKVLLSIVMIALGFTASAQEGFNLGANIGVPTGDAKGFNMAYGFEANYLFKVTDALQMGPSVSYLVYSAEHSNISYLPVAIAARFDSSEKIAFGVDLGYGIDIKSTDISSSKMKSGFYYRPMVGFKASELIMFQAFYSAIKIGGGTAANFGIGLMISL
ncbi:MAG: hypothetical protein KAH07_02700 [Flavobacteriaceae bacterium]|nr:hypothetical protein [Flavobacteriaceae bacterium]